MMARRASLLLLLPVLLLTLFYMPSASAHDMPTSGVYLDFQKNSVAIELRLPLDRLEVAFAQPLTDAPDEVMTTYGDPLKTYVLDRIHPTTTEGQAWTVALSDMTVDQSETPIDLDVKLVATPPAGASVETFILNDDVIVRELLTHQILVTVRSDWNHGLFSTHAKLIGVIRHGETALRIDQSNGSWWIGFGGVVRTGMLHIAEGFDHLMFLMVLLLPAPLLAGKGRWQRFAGAKHSVKQLLKVVTAFTIGHSMTLITGALGWIHLASQPVEVLIAFSILVSALHAFRPIFPGREMYVAGGFGLIHGLAFATLIDEMGITPWSMAFSILGFNIGIELMQLIVIAITVPWLLMLSMTSWYRAVRVAGASLACIASLSWMAERAFSLNTPVTAALELLSAHAIWIVILLMILAFLAYFNRPKQPNRPLTRRKSGSA